MRASGEFIPERVVLQRMKLAAEVTFGRAALEEMELQRLVEPAMDKLVYQLRTFVYSNPAGRVVCVFPATPWDFWKQRWLHRLGLPGRWYLRRHPVRESAKAYSASALFPKADVVVPGLGPAVFHLQPELDYWDG